MSPQNKIKKMVIKIPRHPFIRAQSELNFDNPTQIRKCRVNLERIKGMQASGSCSFPLKAKAKRCCVRVARLPNDERSEISATPASSIVCSDYNEESNDEFTAPH